MGTRHLIIVKNEGEVKVAQYGQWDGYPDGVGTDIVNFLHNIRDPDLMEVFKRRVNLCQWATQDEIDSINEAIEIASKDDPPEGFTLNSIFPEFSRDTSWKVLWLILNGKENYLHTTKAQDYINGIQISQHNGYQWQPAIDNKDTKTLLNNGMDFGNDRTFCEWAWVIDLDENKLECYSGGRQVDGPKGIFEEFDDPVRLQASFDLPLTVEYADFVVLCTPK